MRDEYACQLSLSNACGLYLVIVKTPELQLLFKERPAYIGGVMQLANTEIVQYLCKYPRMPAEKKMD
jgi:hypothetical protein